MSLNVHQLAASVAKAVYQMVTPVVEAFDKLKDTSPILRTFTNAMGTKDNSPNLAPVETPLVPDASLVSMSFWLTLKLRGQVVTVPGGRQFGYIKVKDAVQYQPKRNLETGHTEYLRTKIGKMFDLEPMYASLHQVTLLEQKLEMLENNKIVNRRATESQLSRAALALRKEVLNTLDQILKKEIFKAHSGTNIRSVSAVHIDLKEDEIAVDQKTARKLAKKLKVENVNGLWVIVIRHPVAEASCAIACKLRIVKSNTRVIWLNGYTLKRMGGDCDGDPITITQFRDREQEWAEAEEDLEPMNGPTYFPKSTWTYKSLRKHTFSTSVDRAIGLMTKGFIGKAFNLFERLAIVAALNIPLEDRPKFASEHGFLDEARGNYEGSRWVRVVTAKVKDSAAALYEIIMDFRKYVNDDDPERFATALMEVMDLASGNRSRLNPETFEYATDRNGKLILKDGEKVEVKKDGRSVDAKLINAIMALITSGDSLLEYLNKFPFQGLLVGRHTNEILDRCAKVIHTKGVDHMIDVLSGDVVEEQLLPEPTEAGGGGDKDRERREKAIWAKPKMSEYPDEHLWAYVLDVAEWFDYNKDRAAQKIKVYQYPKYNDDVNTRKGVMLCLPTVGSIFSHTQFSRIAPTKDKSVGGIAVQSRGDGLRFARLIFRCKNANISKMVINTQASIDDAIRQDDILLETILDVLGERIGAACRQNAYLLSKGKGKPEYAMQMHIKSVIDKTISEFSIVPGQTEDEIVDGEVSLVRKEAQVELPDYSNPRTAMDLARRMLSMIQATEAGRPRLHKHPFAPSFYAGFDVGVTSKNAPGKVITMRHHTHALPSIVGVVNLTIGNLDRICRESRTVRFARQLVNGGKIVMTNGREDEIAGIIDKALDAVFIGVSAEFLTAHGVNPDMGALTPYGQQLYARSRRTPIISKVSRAQADIRAKDILDDPTATMDTLLEHGWRIKESDREMGVYKGLPTYETVYTLTGPAPTGLNTWSKIYGFGGHKFVAIPIERNYYVERGNGDLVPVAGLIAIETLQQKKLDEAVWAGLCGLMGKRDFSNVTYETLEAEGQAYLKAAGHEDLLPVYTNDDAGEIVDAGWCMPGLYRTFVLKEDEVISSGMDVATPGHAGSRSSNMLFTRLIGEKPQVDDVTRKHIQVLADMYMQLSQIIVDMPFNDPFEAPAYNPTGKTGGLGADGDSGYGLPSASKAPVVSTGRTVGDTENTGYGVMPRK